MTIDTRKSMRPFNLRRLGEVLSLSKNNRQITSFFISSKIEISQDHAKNILLELTRMNFLLKEDDFFIPNNNVNLALSFIQESNWSGLHDLFYDNYTFYRVYIDEISKASSCTKKELLDLLVTRKDLTFNQTSIDIIGDWAERLGQIQRNLYNNKYYLITKISRTYSYFVEVIYTNYQELNQRLRPGIYLVYVEIAKLREKVCEELKISRESFDSLLTRLVHENIGNVELSGAPLTTSAKDSPSSIKYIEKTQTLNVFSPQYKTIKEGRGLELGRKMYYYIGIFRKLEVN